MTVVIADDESLSRYSLKSMLLEAASPVTIAGEAKNGEELVGIVRRLKPDLAFVDIRMPRLDGLEAITRGIELSPNTRWVILTSYPEFDYAKQALRLGVADYLLKPVAPEELKATLDRVAKALEAERASRMEGFEGGIGALLHHAAPESSMDLRTGIDELRCAAILVLIDGRAEAGGAARAAERLAAALRGALRELVAAERPGALVTLPSGDLCCVLAWSGREGGQGGAAARRLINRFRAIAAADPAACATIVTTEALTRFSDLAQEVWRLQAMRGMRALAGGYASARELSDLANEPAAAGIAAAVERLLDAARSAMPLAFLASLEGMGRLLREAPASFSPARRLSIMTFLSRALPWEATPLPSGERAPAAGPEVIGEWIAALRARGLRGMQRSPEGGDGEDLVDQVRAFLDRRYAEDLKVAEVARLLGITPNYLSNLFHKKTGKRFVHYLAERRIERAKELLLDRHIKVQRVAQSVGFRTTRHFARVFRAECGLYPSEFRAMALGGDASSSAGPL